MNRCEALQCILINFLTILYEWCVLPFLYELLEAINQGWGDRCLVEDTHTLYLTSNFLSDEQKSFTFGWRSTWLIKRLDKSLSFHEISPKIFMGLYQFESLKPTLLIISLICYFTHDMFLGGLASWILHTSSLATYNMNIYERFIRDYKKQVVNQTLFPYSFKKQNKGTYKIKSNVRYFRSTFPS